MRENIARPTRSFSPSHNADADVIRFMRPKSASCTRTAAGSMMMGNEFAQQQSIRETYTVHESPISDGPPTVWKGKHKQTGREVAIKAVAKELLNDLQEFRRYVKVGKQLKSNKHMVCTVDVHEDDSSIYLVSTLVHGTSSLTDLLGGLLKEHTCQLIFWQICNAVNVLHKDCLLVHGSLTPDNMLIAYDGTTDSFTLHMTMFSCNRFMNTQQRMTANFLFAAPEQIKSRSASRSYESDIWSLGVLLYWMCSGSSPFGDATTAKEQIIENIISGQPDWSSNKWALMPDQKDLISRMLSPDPSMRPTIADCMEHIWLQNCRDNTDSNSPLKYRDSVKQSRPCTPSLSLNTDMCNEASAPTRGLSFVRRNSVKVPPLTPSIVSPSSSFSTSPMSSINGSRPCTPLASAGRSPTFPTQPQSFETQECISPKSSSGSLSPVHRRSSRGVTPDFSRRGSSPIMRSNSISLTAYANGTTETDSTANANGDKCDEANGTAETAADAVTIMRSPIIGGNKGIKLTPINPPPVTMQLRRATFNADSHKQLMSSSWPMMSGQQLYNR